ncbi:hypothetical protein M3Y99_01253000 [Aphelenchoides fujianensis]|nr:hypothetical protein M3Y99_01253000 [Aphelenchoides fujianensis]
MASTSKTSSGGDFASFWKFYATAHEWPLQSEEFLKRAGEDFCLHAYAECSSTDQRALLQQAAEQQTKLHRTAVEAAGQVLEQHRTEQAEEDEYEDEEEGTGAEDGEDYAEDGDYGEDGWYEEEELEEVMEEMHCDDQVMGDEEEMTPEMLEFVRVTQQHRKELAEKRAREAEEAAKERAKSTGAKPPKQAAEKSWLEVITDAQADDYVMADTIGVHGVQQATTFEPVHLFEAAGRKKRNATLYGAAAARINEAESQVHSRFEGVLNNTKASLWPNIPLRFS